MAALQYIIELHEKKRRVLFSRQGSDRKKLELHLYQQLEELQREVTCVMDPCLSCISAPPQYGSCSV